METYSLQIGRLFTSFSGLPPQSTAALLTPPPPPPSPTDTEESEDTEQQEEGRDRGGEGAGAGGGERKGLAECAAGACMIGVDISAQMARLALANGGYSLTLCADLDSVLRQFFSEEEGAEQGGDRGGSSGGGPLQPLDLLVAADTFLYVGALEEVRRSDAVCCLLFIIYLFIY